jgi:hypothetical protein
VTKKIHIFLKIFRHDSPAPADTDEVNVCLHHFSTLADARNQLHPMDLLQEQMTVYFLNSGDRQLLSSASVHTSARMLLRPLVRRGGSLPFPFEGFTVEVAHADGSSLFTLSRNRTPILIAGLGWTKRGGKEIWDNLERTYLDLSDGYADLMGATHLPGEAPELPWLGLILVPGFTILAQDCWGWLGDFGCSFGWTLLIERNLRPDAERPRDAEGPLEH